MAKEEVVVEEELAMEEREGKKEIPSDTKLNNNSQNIIISLTRVLVIYHVFI